MAVNWAWFWFTLYALSALAVLVVWPTNPSTTDSPAGPAPAAADAPRSHTSNPTPLRAHAATAARFHARLQDLPPADLRCDNFARLGITSPNGLVGQGLGSASYLVSHGKQSNGCAASGQFGLVDAGRSAVSHASQLGFAPRNALFAYITHVHKDHTLSVPDWIYTRGNSGFTVIGPDNVNFTGMLANDKDSVLYEVWSKKNFISTLQFPNQTTTFIPAPLTNSITLVHTVTLPAGAGTLKVWSIETDHSRAEGVAHVSGIVETPLASYSFSGDQTEEPAKLGWTAVPGTSNWEYISTNAPKRPRVTVGHPYFDALNCGFDWIAPSVAFLHGQHMSTTHYGRMANRSNADIAYISHAQPLVGGLTGPGSNTQRLCDFGDGNGPVPAPARADEYVAMMRDGGYTGPVSVSVTDPVLDQFVELPVVSVSLLDMKTDPPTVVVAGLSNYATIDLAALKVSRNSNKYTLRADAGTNGDYIYAAFFSVEGGDVVDGKLEDGDGAAPFCIANEQGDDDENHAPRTGDCKKWGNWPTEESVITVTVVFKHADANGKLWSGFPYHINLNIIPFDD